MQYAILSSVACPALPRFSTLTHERHDFRGKNVIEQKICLNFCKGFVWNISHSTNNSDTLPQMYIGLHVKYLLLLSDFRAGVNSWSCRLSRWQPWTQASGRQGRFGETFSMLNSPRVEQYKSYLHDGAARSSETSINISQTTCRYKSRNFCDIYKFACDRRLLSLFALNIAFITPRASSKYFSRRWLWIRRLFSKLSGKKY